MDCAPEYLFRPKQLVIFAGISGIDKASILDKVKQQIAGASASIEQINFEEVLLRNDRSQDIATFLNRSSAKLKMDAIEAACVAVGRKLKTPDSHNKTVFLNMHFTYFYASNFLLNLANANLSALTGGIDSIPVRIVTLIDDAYVIRHNIEIRETDYPNTAMRLREIIAWRSLEMSAAETAAKSLSTPEREVANYTVAVRHPTSTFCNLIFEEEPRCIYLSYPISKTRDNQQLVNEINKFRQLMHKETEKRNIVLFDPVTIDERILTIQPDASSKDGVRIDKSKRWPICWAETAKPFDATVSIPEYEIKEVKSDIDNQIRARDFVLIDKAKMIVVYKPFLGGDQKISEGVQSEMRYGTDAGKKVVVRDDMETRKTKEEDNPFSGKYPTYGSNEELLEAIDRAF